MKEFAILVALIAMGAFVFFLLRTIYLKIRGRDTELSKRNAFVSFAAIIISFLVAAISSPSSSKTVNEPVKVAATNEDTNKIIENNKVAADSEKAEQERLAAEKAEQERLAAEKAEKKRLDEQRKAEEAARKEAEMIAKYGDKVTVKEYLEKTQPFAALDFIKSYVCDISGPLANGDRENLRNYAFYILVTGDDFKKSVANYGEIAKMCQEYYLLEGDIAAGYFKAKKDGIFSLNTVTTTADLAKQTKLKADIYSVAHWCGADLNEFAETKFIQRAGGAIKDFLAKHPPTD